MAQDYSIISFESQSEFRTWLSEHFDSCDGIWLKIFKKATNIPTITYAEALDEALCFGWIDGLRKSHDGQSFLQKFTPRRNKSLWSKRNIEYIERLTNAGLMTPSGFKEVEDAKQDGRWDAAYDKPSNMVMPEDFLNELSKGPKAKAFFNSLSKTNTYAIGWSLQTAKKPETRLRRMEKILQMLEAEEKQY